MKVRGTLLPALSLACLCFLGASCASSAPPLPAGSPPRIDIRILGAQEIKDRFGELSQGNPFLEPRRFTGTRIEEFIVVGIDILAAGGEEAMVIASARGGDGKPVAFQRDLRYMVDFWEGHKSADPKVNARRSSGLDRYYAPDGGIKLRKGLSRYVVVLSSQTEIPRPSTVSISVSGPGIEAKMLTLDLPDATP